ncbi:MAG: type II secretion system minor pseudopilin GspI, partial [Burkholderiales bacterium]
NTRGFTLLEVLVALAILAVALAAAVRATSIAIDSAAELKARLLAGWVAQNRLAEHIARRSFPSAGENEGSANQANLRFRWREIVSETPNPAFRKIVIAVFSEGEESRALAELTAYLNPPVEQQ